MITTHLEHNISMDMEEHGITFENDDPMLSSPDRVFISKEQAISAAKLILKFYKK